MTVHQVNLGCQFCLHPLENILRGGAGEREWREREEGEREEGEREGGMREEWGGRRGEEERKEQEKQNNNTVYNHMFPLICLSHPHILTPSPLT